MLGRVLVLDDDEACLDLASAGLALAGFAVETFHDYRELEDRFESFRPDVIVLDRCLPRASGDMLAVQLAGTLGPYRPPIVLWTGDPRREAEAAFVSFAAEDVVVKGQQGIDVLVERIIHLAGWGYLGPGLYLKRAEGTVFFRGQLTKPLSRHEVEFLFRLGLAGKEGVERGRAKLILLKSLDGDSTDLQLNRAIYRLKKRLCPALRERLITVREKGWILDV